MFYIKVLQQIKKKERKVSDNCLIIVIRTSSALLNKMATVGILDPGLKWKACILSPFKYDISYGLFVGILYQIEDVSFSFLVVKCFNTNRD